MGRQSQAGTGVVHAPLTLDHLGAHLLKRQSMESANANMRETEPQDDVTIWRYMDLPRFISMLSTRQLRFTKAASYRDDPGRVSAT